MEKEVPINPHIFRRAKILLVIAGSVAMILLCRILMFQTVGYDRYQQNVIDQITTESKVNAARGNIYDRNGVLLAGNITTYRVFLSPSSIASAQTEHNKNGENIHLDELIADNLSPILNVERDFVLTQIGYKKYLDRTIKKQVDEDTADLVREFIAEYGLEQMIYLQTTSTRYYPYGSLASHVLGFTGSDGTGLYGLEYYYDELLSGTNGRYITARDARGNEMPYSYKEYIEAQNGQDITTTLDVYVQSALEEQVKTAYINAGGQNRAAGIVMDVNTGEVLGMAVYPDFDLNEPRTLDEQSLEKLEAMGLDPASEEYSKAKQELLLSMWSNKAITEAYIPGSTFKVITASMALEENVVSLDETLTCTGSLKVSGRTIHCHQTRGHGTLTFPQGIQQSCNPWLMTVGLRLGTNTFYSYLKAFGYLERTGIDLPGEGKSIFAAEEDFTDLDLAIYAFGQNFNVTLIQQITGVSTVANGGNLVTPHLFLSSSDQSGNVISKYNSASKRQVVSTETCQTVAQILEEGVSGNGGAKNAYVAGYRIAAKTGTSEKKNAGSEGKYVCSTVAFAPAENPQYATIIIVDEPSKGILYGSTVAAPYVGKVMETILPYLGVEAVFSEEELEKMAVTVPKCIGWSQAFAKQMLESSQYGLAYEFVGDPDGIIYKQFPEAGSVLERQTGKIILYTTKNAIPDTVTVPNVTGMNAVAANQTLVNAGLNVRILGTKNYISGTGATAIMQSIPPGSEVPRGSVVEVTFRYLEDTD